LSSSPQAAFFDASPTEKGLSNFSVLIRGSSSGGSSDGVEEVFRVRLPSNPYSGRGVIIGEGKPENQNHAVIFAFGEALQTIDMNQVCLGIERSVGLRC
jgi:hypothetical protein